MNKRQRAIEREKKRFAYEIERDPRALGKFLDSLVAKGYTTQLEISECRRRMKAAGNEEAAMRIKNQFLKRIMHRVEKEASNGNR